MAGCIGEWQDVLGAIAIVKQISVTTDVILFGIGTGCTSSLLAYSSLPPEGANENTLSEYSQNIRNLNFDRSYIIGMILDSPAKESDDYIRPEVVQSSLSIRFLMQSEYLQVPTTKALLQISQDSLYLYLFFTAATIHLSEPIRSTR